MKKIILMLIAFTTIACGCKKYEEGPLISFRSAKNRIYGYHTLTKYTVNGIDSLDRFNEELGLIVEFKNIVDINEYDVCIMAGYTKNGNLANFYWGWELQDNNKILKCLGYSGNSAGIGVFKKGLAPAWKIIKLKKNDIKLTTTHNDVDYLLELK
jgi:hypothetical protein